MLVSLSNHAFGTPSGPKSSWTRSPQSKLVRHRNVLRRRHQRQRIQRTRSDADFDFVAVIYVFGVVRSRVCGRGRGRGGDGSATGPERFRWRRVVRFRLVSVSMGCGIEEFVGEVLRRRKVAVAARGGVRWRGLRWRWLRWRDFFDFGGGRGLWGRGCQRRRSLGGGESVAALGKRALVGGVDGHSGGRLLVLVGIRRSSRGWAASRTAVMTAYRTHQNGQKQTSKLPDGFDANRSVLNSKLRVERHGVSPTA